MTPLNTVLRSSLAFIALWVVTRLTGKKQAAKITVFDYVTGITIGSITASIATNTSLRPVDGVIALLIYTVAASGLGWLSANSYLVRKIAEGEPTVVVQNGKMLEDNMSRCKYSTSELMMQLREKNVFDIGQVEFAVLETDGTLSVLKKSQDLAITPKDVGVDTAYEGVSTEIIVDGTVLEQNLKQK